LRLIRWGFKIIILFEHGRWLVILVVNLPREWNLRCLHWRIELILLGEVVVGPPLAEVVSELVELGSDFRIAEPRSVHLIAVVPKRGPLASERMLSPKHINCPFLNLINSSICF